MKNNYLINIHRIEKESLLENENVLTNDYSENKLDFLRFKSGYKKIFSDSEINDEELLNLFLSVKTHQAIAENDLYYKNSYNNKNITEIPDENQPKIFCSFHLGSYTILPILLAKYKIALIVNKKTLFTKGSKFIEVAKTNNIKEFDIIDAEESSSLINIIKKVKQGFSLFFYLDGNTGVGGFDRNDDKLEKIDFLGKKLLSRKGVAFLAYKLNLTIVPLYTYRENNQNFIINDSSISTKNLQHTSIEDFCFKCTQLLWSKFEKILLKYPHQWEGWQYIFNFFIRNKKYEEVHNFTERDVEYSVLSFSKGKDVFFKNEKFYIYDYFNFQTIEISKIIFIVLLNLKNKKLIISFNDLSKLLSKNTILNLINNKTLSITK